MPSGSSKPQTSLRGLLAIGLFALLSGGCGRKPLKNPRDALRLARSVPELRDDLPRGTLIDAVQAEVDQLARAPGRRELRFGAQVYTREEYLKGLRRFLELARGPGSPEAFEAAVRSEFDFYEVYGQKAWGDAFMTSYYAPVIEGSPVRQGRFTQPLYGVPSDLISLNLETFDPKFADERKYRGRVDGKALVPYYSREEIDSRGKLKGRGLELCWMDPIDAFVLQIQGSGQVRLADGGILNVNYAEKNGQPYQSIGNFLRDVIPPSNMSMPSIEAYLRSLLYLGGRQALQGVLNLNPSYVFFRLSPESAVTYLGIPATDGRTIATDPRFFPKGALAFLLSPKPSQGPGESVSRFVLDQDTGGAIRGGGRVDLFWGKGFDAQLHSGVIQQHGRLYYLAPRR